MVSTKNRNSSHLLIVKRKRPIILLLVLKIKCFVNASSFMTNDIVYTVFKFTPREDISSIQSYFSITF